MPDGFEVSPRQTEIKLAASDRVSLPVALTVKPGVDPGKYRMTVKILKDDGSLELERSATVEHLGPHGRMAVPATEDTAVHAGYPDRNWGTAAQMMVDGGNAKMGDDHHTLAYLRFKLNPPGKVVSTRLRLYNAGNPSSDSGHVCLTTQPWSGNPTHLCIKTHRRRGIGKAGKGCRKPSRGVPVEG